MFSETQGALTVGTARNMRVPVLLEIHDSEPTADFDDWQYVIESSPNLQSGRLVIRSIANVDYHSIDVPQATIMPECHMAGWARSMTTI
jgi:hypothetical protein